MTHLSLFLVVSVFAALLVSLLNALLRIWALHVTLMNYFLRAGMLRQSKHVDYFTLDVSTFITYVRLEFFKKKMQECVGLAVLDKLTCALRSW